MVRREEVWERPCWPRGSEQSRGGEVAADHAEFIGMNPGEQLGSKLDFQACIGGERGILVSSSVNQGWNLKEMQTQTPRKGTSHSSEEG